MQHSRLVVVKLAKQPAWTDHDDRWSCDDCCVEGFDMKVDMEDFIGQAPFNPRCCQCRKPFFSPTASR